VKKPLSELKLELEQLERIVIDEYFRLEAEAAVTEGDYIRVPEGVAKWFQHHVSSIWDDLFGGEGGRLTLVSEEHDEVRLRLMVLERLLERDIPFDYLERALRRSLVLGTSPPAPARAPLRVVQVEAVPSTQRIGWRARLGGWLHAWGQWLRTGARARLAESAADTPVDRPAPVVPVITPVVQVEGGEQPLSEHLQRLLFLYRIMQEDPQGLVRPGQQLGPLNVRVALGGEVARFYARDLGEQFWYRRDPGREGAARTPDELRRKLQGRNHVYTGERPRDAA